MERKKRITDKVVNKLKVDPADEIRRCLEHGSRWLHLGNRGLTEVPLEVLALKELETIDLSENELRTIPEQLLSLPKLRSICLIGNPIEVLPDHLEFTIDVNIYRRCCKHLDKNKILLVIGLDTSPEDAEYLIEELKTGEGPKRLTVGKWSIVVGDEHRQPSPVLLRFSTL